MVRKNSLMFGQYLYKNLVKQDLAGVTGAFLSCVVFFFEVSSPKTKIFK